jgi:hypothetical protein
MLDPAIVKSKYIEKPLNQIRLLHPNRVALCLRIGAVESDFGTHPKQINGPALGFYGYEPRTYECMKKNALPRIWHKVKGVYFPDDPGFLIYDLAMATQAVAIQLSRFSEPIPDLEDIWGQARYWKTYWNTSEGKGTEEEFVKKSFVYVESLLKRD